MMTNRRALTNPLSGHFLSSSIFKAGNNTVSTVLHLSARSANSTSVANEDPFVKKAGEK